MVVDDVDGCGWLWMTWMVADDHGWLWMVVDRVVDGAIRDYCVECREKQKEYSLGGWEETIACDVVVY